MTDAVDRALQDLAEFTAQAWSNLEIVETDRAVWVQVFGV